MSADKQEKETRRNDPSSAGPQSRTRFPVVGIGASAGGLEACTTLLKTLAPDLGMAYVVIPHLDRSRESAYADILARATKMPVSEAKDGTMAEPNHVYVIPRNCEMTIVEGAFHLSSLDLPRSAPVTIDIFLRSLAADSGSNAIGVILSGTASDGTIGMTAIKGEGGITFAQDASAKYDGMPSSAVAAGCVDFVLPPESISSELARIAKHPYVLRASEEEDAGGTREAKMVQIFGILHRATRVDFSEYKPPTIGRRVARRMALHKIEGLGDYVGLLRRDHDEVKALYHDLLINVTSFFRDAQVFEALKVVVYPELVRAHGETSTPIRIWVPGCSTGEETYSHAISLLEYLGEQRTEVPIQIFGTDLSDTAIRRARQGLFKDVIETDVSPARLRRFFQKVDSGYQISKTVRDLCIFSTQNVFNDPPFSRIDLVSCRNVMIYLSQSLQRRVIPIFHYALNTHGFLIIGNTEGLLASADLFEMADKKQKIYRKRGVPTPVTFGVTVQAVGANIDGEASTGGGAAGQVVKAPIDLQREADRLLLARYAPPSVTVNDYLDVVQTKGRTGAFLELPSGKASLNLLKLARPGLLHELQSAIDEARKRGAEIVRPDVPVEGNGDINLSTIRVTPFKAPTHDRFSFLIAFESSANAAPAPAPAPTLDLTPQLSDDERTLKDKQFAQLKQELAATKEYLQSIIEALESTNEELQSANEEIQSGNEELQSTNEELQTSKEELESANEELHTVNEEMQHRNDQLTLLNNDLTNLLNSVNLPMVMLGPDLSIRRFTAEAAKVLGLTTSDVGRPLTRLKLNANIGNLERMLLKVISEVRTKQYRVGDLNGHPCYLRLTPYRTADNRSDGVVLSILPSNKTKESGNLRPANSVKVPPTDARKRNKKKK